MRRQSACSQMCSSGHCESSVHARGGALALVGPEPAGGTVDGEEALALVSTAGAGAVLVPRERPSSFGAALTGGVSGGAGSASVSRRVERNGSKLAGTRGRLGIGMMSAVTLAWAVASPTAATNTTADIPT